MVVLFKEFFIELSWSPQLFKLLATDWIAGPFLDKLKNKLQLKVEGYIIRRLGSKSKNRQEKRASKVRVRISNLLIVSGILVILFPLATEAYGYYRSLKQISAWDYQAKNQRAQAERIRNKQDCLITSGQLPDEESIVNGAFSDTATGNKPGAENRKPFPKTKIIIPKIGVNQVVLEGTSSDTLKLGPGHYSGMANPGENGNIGIAGHRVTYTHPFNRLDELSKGDSIILETIDYVYEYRVETMLVVDPKDVSTLNSVSVPEITLTTCNPKYSARTRLNVKGVLVDTRPKQASIVRVVKEIFKGRNNDVKLANRVKTYEELLRDLESAKRAVKKNQLSVDAYINLAEANLELRRYPEAIDALKRGEFIDPKSPEVTRLFQVIDQKKEELRGKISNGEKNSPADGTIDPSIYLDLGHIHMALGEYEEAIAVFDKGVSAFLHASDMYFHKATAYEATGENELALDTYEEALIYDPAYPEALRAIKRIKNEKLGVTPNSNNLHYRLRPQ